VILSVDDKPIASFEALEGLVDSLTRGKDTRVPALVAFDRSGERLLTVIELGRPGLEDPGLEARKAWVPISVQVLTRELADRLNLPAARACASRVSAHAGGRVEGGRRHHDTRRQRDWSISPGRRLFATLIRQHRLTTVMLTIVGTARPAMVSVKVDASAAPAR
jgi:hypothetical protein